MMRLPFTIDLIVQMSEIVSAHQLSPHHRIVLVGGSGQASFNEIGTSGESAPLIWEVGSKHRPDMIGKFDEG